MKSIKFSQVLFPFFLLFFSINLSNAQKSISFKIDYLMPEGGFSKIEKSTIENLTDKFLSKGYEIGKNPKWKILLNIYHLDKPDSGKIIISYTLSQSLPKPIIDFGIKNEVFYLVTENKERKEGQNKQVREYLTSEFLHQFSMIIDSKLHMVEQSKINSKLDEVVEEIDKNINFRQ